ncbi:MAG: efflux RND transporter permease subunit, partial [Kiritimatiellae bacterium]|nr:efflux RND transporter permease subunit [Kiritimatiellia bacterium]
VICLRSPKGTMSRLQISDYIYGNILPVLLRIPGVGEATVYGPKLSMRVWMDPDRMAAQGLNSEEVIAAVTKQNVQASVGSVGASPIPAHGAKVYTLTAKGRLMTPKEFNEIVIRSDANGGLVKLKDIARMEVGEENYMFTGQFNGDNVVAIVLQQKHGANAIATMDMIQKQMYWLAQSFPEDLEWITPYDATDYMRMCVKEIVTTLLFAFCLVVLVCYLFLQDWRAPLIPCLTILVSLCSTFILMAIFGYTINILTLFGLVLAIGVVVADCIVVVENIQTLMATEGLSAKEAASKSMHQITGAVITTTLVTVACYIPFAFYGGMVGKMGIQFAFTMCVALCLSTFVALTLSPALCSLLLRPPKKRLSVMCLLARRSLIIAIVILLFTVVPFERFIILVLVALCLHFLQDWRATLISALSIAPLLASLLLLAVLNPLDTLTPYGFIIVVCSLMDNVIVAVKNSRALMVREGLSAKEAVKKSLRQVIGAVIVTTFVTVVCYFFLLRGGDCPFCFRASVILFVVLSLSAFVAFLLLPVFCALLLRPPKERHLVIKGYLSVVRFLVRRGAITAVLFAEVAGSCWVLKDRVKKTLLPDEDKGVVFASMEMPEGTARDRSRDAALRAVEMLRQMPEVAGVQSITGWGMIGGRGENLATLIIDLKGWDKRSLPEQHAAMLVGKIQALLDTVPEPKWQVFMPPAISGLGRIGGVSFNLCSDSGADATALAAAAQAFARRIQELPEAGRVTCGFRADTPHLRLSLDRQKAERHHVPVATIYAALQNYLGSRYVNDVNLGTQVNRVTVAAEASARATPEAVEGLYVRSDLGAMVPVGSLGTISRELGPREITRFNKMPSASINAQVAPGVAPLELISAIERAGAPECYHIEWSERSLLEKENQGRLALLMVLAALFAYLFLVAQYESWTFPLPVMCSVVFALAGAYAGLWITGTPMSIYAQLGL